VSHSHTAAPRDEETTLSSMASAAADDVAMGEPGAQDSPGDAVSEAVAESAGEMPNGNGAAGRKRKADEVDGSDSASESESASDALDRLYRENPRGGNYLTGGHPIPDADVQLRTLNDELTCVVCLGILRDVRVVMKCLHRFCAECIGKVCPLFSRGCRCFFLCVATDFWFCVRAKKKCIRLGNRECPTCRNELTSRRDLREDKNFDALVEAIYGNLDDFEKAQDAAVHRINKQHLRSRTLQESMRQGVTEQDVLKKTQPKASRAKVSAKAAPKKSRRTSGPSAAATRAAPVKPKQSRRAGAAGTIPAPSSVPVGPVDGKLSFFLHRHSLETGLERLLKPKLTTNVQVSVRLLRKFAGDKLKQPATEINLFAQDSSTAAPIDDNVVVGFPCPPLPPPFVPRPPLHSLSEVLTRSQLRDLWDAHMKVKPTQPLSLFYRRKV
jgi:hypothetical protein